MSKYEDMLAALRQSVAGVAEAPEAEREDLLTKNFAEFGEEFEKALTEEREEAFQAGLRQEFGRFAVEQGLVEAPMAKGDGDADEDLAKNIGHIAEYAGILRSVEMFLDRLKDEAEGRGFVASSDRDPDARQHAAAMHDLVSGWYGLGVRVLQQMANAEAAEELDDEEEAAMKADFVGFGQALGLLDEGGLAKAEPGEDEMADDEEAEMEVDEGAPMDPLDTLERLLAAALVVTNAIKTADGDDEDEAEEEDEEAEEEVERAEKAVATEALAKSHAQAAAGEIAVQVVEEVTELREELSNVTQALAAAQAQLAKLADQPAPAKGVLRAVERSEGDPLGKGESLEQHAERLTKMSPEDRTRELIKLAQSNPLRV